LKVFDSLPTPTVGETATVPPGNICKVLDQGGVNYATMWLSSGVVRGAVRKPVKHHLNSTSFYIAFWELSSILLILSRDMSVKNELHAMAAMVVVQLLMLCLVGGM
jgi:hypothetical protein